MAGTATLTDPIITALVSEPRIIDRLMAQRAEGVTACGVSEPLAASAEAACLSGGCGGVVTCCSFICRQVYEGIALGQRVYCLLKKQRSPSLTPPPASLCRLTRSALPK